VAWGILLDCTPDEVAALEAMLAGFRAQGLINYGLHRADSALMTCLVFSLTDSEHVHFIDAVTAASRWRRGRSRSRLPKIWHGIPWNSRDSIRIFRRYPGVARPSPTGVDKPEPFARLFLVGLECGTRPSTCSA
jgi:hypothetical protein